MLPAPCPKRCALDRRGDKDIFGMLAIFVVIFFLLCTGEVITTVLSIFYSLSSSR